MTITKTAASAAFALSLLAAPVMAQGLMDWDLDADGVFSQDEFNTGFTNMGAYGGWDTDADGMLNQDEFGAGFGDVGGDFGAWDADGDGLLTQDEWNAGNFSRYDVDRSGSIDASEVNQMDTDLGQGGLFNM